MSLLVTSLLDVPDMSGLTEWEKAKEKEDFARAAMLYRPLSNMMASRFTTAKYADHEKDVQLPDTNAVRLISSFDMVIERYNQIF